MVEQLVPDDLWALVEPHIPPQASRPRGGRTRMEPRRTLAGIVYLLRWGLPWRALPLAIGLGSGRTCERRFREWREHGLWRRLHHVLLNHAAQHGHLDWLRAALDSISFPAPRGGEDTGPNPTDRGKKGSKIHLVIDAAGLPLGVTISGANVHDNQRFEATLDAVPPVRNGRPGRPRCRPTKLHADKGYDAQRCRQALRARGITPRIARRGIESSERLGRWRWRVERTLSWLMAYRKIAVRRERCASTFTALVELACTLLVWRRTRQISVTDRTG